jgi:hypothetical protein
MAAQTITRLINQAFSNLTYESADGIGFMHLLDRHLKQKRASFSHAFFCLALPWRPYKIRFCIIGYASIPS